MRFPPPLRAGDRIGITAPSSGVPDALRGRLDFAVETIERRGFEVELGEHLGENGSHVSAPVEQRAAELMRMLLDPAIAAIVPPWGGETAIDLIPHLDFNALRSHEPKWVVGFSDISTLLLPLTLVGGWATLHGDNLMDTPFESLFPSWMDVAASARGTVLRQAASRVQHSGGWDDWSEHPRVTEWQLAPAEGWRRLDPGTGDLDVEGTLIGGCIETISRLAGTRFGNTSTLDGPHLVYLEAAEENAFSICRALHGMRLAGFFDRASAIMIGRTSAPDSPGLTQDEAVLDALAMLGVPIVAGTDIGHVPPQLKLVNGATARLRMNEDERWLEQTL